MEIKKIISNNIKNARKEKGITQQYIADKWHIKQTAYSRFERGIFELDYYKIIDICKILDITPNDLFEGCF